MLRLSWLISMGLSLLGVIMIDYFFTMKAADTANASGNLGALGIALVAPFLLLSMLTTFRFFVERSRHTQDTILRTFLLMLGIGLIAFFAYSAIQYKQDVYNELGGPITNPQSIIYGFPLVNEYTNNIFVNFYTFGLVHASIAVIGALYGMLKPPSPLVEERVEDQA